MHSQGCVALLDLTPAGDLWAAEGVVRCSTEGSSARLEEGAETAESSKHPEIT